MEWLYRIFFKEEFEARWFTPLVPILFWGGAIYVIVHFVRKYW